MLKEVVLSKQGAAKLFKKSHELYFGDLDGSIKQFIPGAWVLFKNVKKNICYLGYVNPLVANDVPCAYVFDEWDRESQDEESYLLKQIDKSIAKRELLQSYGSDARLVYGDADNLPGLIVDSYQNIILVQINTAGIDRHRATIKTYLSERFKTKKIYVLDNPKYRERELLPFFEKDELEESIHILENGLKFTVPKDGMQKIGYYYDHRENRKRAANLVSMFNKEFTSGLDLFCYVGSWGLNVLKAGCQHVTFVDQGSFDQTIKQNLHQNGFDEGGTFYKSNVFHFLEAEIEKGKTYDLICSDPPAFCKSKREAKQALDGYMRLHKNIFKLLTPQSLLIACSCTHYISLEEFEQSVQDAARLSDRKIQLLDVGLQGYDHPTEKLFSKNTYLKYFAYFVE